MDTDSAGQPLLQQRSDTPAPTTAPPAIAGAQKPQQAADDELVEHEWVEAVKHAIRMNQHDPYALNVAVADLRAHYLLTRYGKKLAQS